MFNSESPPWCPQRAVAGRYVQLGAQRVAGAADALAAVISAAKMAGVPWFNEQNWGKIWIYHDVTSKIEGKKMLVKMIQLEKLKKFN